LSVRLSKITDNEMTTHTLWVICQWTQLAAWDQTKI